MREIKFRAWDGEKMYYQDNADFIFSKSISVYPTNEYSDYSGPDFINFKELMEYTGLKDRNDKEIYEGDIVKRNNNAEGYSDAWSEKLYTVGWDSKEARFVLMEDGHWGLIWRMEVIGNIYEHNHLLNENGKTSN